MKITSLNLQEFKDWESRQPIIIDYLQTESPDIILFQEVVFLPDTSPYNQAQVLNETLGYPVEQSAVTRLQPSHAHETYREGLAALSRYPVVKSDTIILKQASGDEHNRIIQLLDIDIDGSILKIANIHFSITDITDFATAHLEETLEILKSRGEKRIIAGDFNLSFLEDSFELWGDEYRSSTDQPYVTFPRLDKRVDYFLIPKEYSFISISTSGDGLSDHRALTADIKVS